MYRPHCCTYKYYNNNIILALSHVLLVTVGLSDRLQQCEEAEEESALSQQGLNPIKL